VEKKTCRRAGQPSAPRTRPALAPAFIRVISHKDPGHLTQGPRSSHTRIQVISHRDPGHLTQVDPGHLTQGSRSSHTGGSRSSHTGEGGKEGVEEQVRLQRLVPVQPLRLRRASIQVISHRWWGSIRFRSSHTGDHKKPPTPPGPP